MYTVFVKSPFRKAFETSSCVHDQFEETTRENITLMVVARITRL
jgi:hypothetical protein